MGMKEGIWGIPGPVAIGGTCVKGPAGEAGAVGWPVLVAVCVGGAVPGK